MLCRLQDVLTARRIFLAENWRRRSKFEEVSFIFPNAPNIPITLVCIIASHQDLADNARTWA
jgi:hypothetical protein